MNRMNLVNNLYSWYSTDKVNSTIKQLSENQILNIANEINGLFSETNLIEAKPELALPRLCVVGTQSSGKSSVLNAIMSMDLLPTGKNMVTRTPIDLRLHQLKGSTDGWVEFGDYTGEGWITEKKISIKMPIPLDSEITEIREYIMKKTNDVAGEGMNISPKPIIINIYSPNVPNLSLVDLPGLTMVACTDKGQPEDIRERIENLVVSYIKEKKTIVIAVMQARSDLETDIGLALIKKYDISGQRIVGVLTKPDLMNHETNIGEYLTNNISKNLMLTYGYYVVKNRNGQEMKDVNILKGFELEKEYFNNHYEYKKPLYKDRIGSHNLTASLSKILIASITEVLPSVMTEIVSLENKLNEKLDKIGQELPTTKEGKLAFMNKYVSNFHHRFMDSIESRGTVLNTGKMIKDNFVTYRKELLEIKPFSNTKIYNQDYFKNIIASFEGNHMSFHIPPIQILEACMTDSRYKPIMTLQDKSLKCVDNICELIINLIRNLTLQEEFAQYPQLASTIMSVLIDEIIAKSKDKTKQHINKLLKNECDYIWTDSKEFMALLSQMTKANSSEIEPITNFLEGYFSSIKTIIAHNVPKIIMSDVIREIETMMLSFLLQCIVVEDKLPLLKQDDEIEKQRMYYSDLRNRVITIKKNFKTN
ncbi:dynamin GTPase [Fadolivirus algeromassiliense]|jgi:dynamin 1-like protein|uniref:Dynamin GTPase n=1 Tax=Fadolivirus FV1/VV64 TaxID=3070911 RepID=A0A7D3QUM1_9VIRU|nr:dynamin GTPase [Fadolivirus algeromassiliense]QKF94243.1 dynamin GTPase [Fadolivirus FV1/VV64]